MPQLSPLNWILIFFMVWSSYFLTMGTIYWHNKYDYSPRGKSSTKPTLLSYKWMW